MRSLLDVGLLIALFDPAHLDHHAARAWLEEHITDGWASCALTQNGFVRIISQPSYPNSVTTADAIATLRHACESRHHEPVTGEVSLLDPAHVDASKVLGPKQVSDVYLLALAVAHGLRLVTLDRRVSISAVPTATADHLVIL